MSAAGRQARAITAELLRLLPNLPLDDALQAEAMAAEFLPPQACAADAGQVRVRASQGMAITLDHPAQGNRLTRAMWADLGDALEAARLDGLPLTITGEGPDFCLGAATPAPLSLLRTYADLAPRVTLQVQGGCAGAGLGFLLAAQVVAKRDAWFAAPEPLPSFGAITALLRRIGVERAAVLLLEMRRIDAQTALAWGLIDRLV